MLTLGIAAEEGKVVAAAVGVADDGSDDENEDTRLEVLVDDCNVVCDELMVDRRDEVTI